jgi:predicted NBD/HSP70 family sugar kinase/mannose-6-phosphate isomerase class I
MAYYIALDIGGSHITSGLVHIQDEKKEVENIFHKPVDSSASAAQIIEHITDCIIAVSKHKAFPEIIQGIGISMPGPFDYKKGISRIAGVNKFDSLFALDVKTSLQNRLPLKNIHIHEITFLNDAESFLLGVLNQDNYLSEKVLALTIGTGIGSASYSGGELFSGLMDDNYLYKSKFKNGRAEDYFSTKWFLNQASEKSIDVGTGVEELAKKVEYSPDAQEIFDQFGKNLAEYLNGLISQTEVDRIVFGGKIFKSFYLFVDSFNRYFTRGVKVQIASNTSEYSLLGAVVHHQNESKERHNKIRNSISPVLPIQKPIRECEAYDIYPTHSLGKNKIYTGYQSLMKVIRKQDYGKITIDGSIGTIWDEVITQLNHEFTAAGINVSWYCIDAASKTEGSIASMLEGFLGGDDPLFGFNYTGTLKNFFDEESLDRITSNEKTISIIYGTGAALAGWEGPLIYIDQPKNEIQFRSRAGSISNIGASKSEDAKKMYKRFYFVDWPVCNKHKKDLLPKLSVIVDGQRPETITWMEGNKFREGLEKIVQNPFRVRPWFEPGVWGGQWMKKKFKGLNTDVENFAWSFEIIAPENGVIFESDGTMLEVGFEFLLYHNNKAVLGQHAEEYGCYFPLRFDYLDTMDGENLSLQCHPKLEYIRENFGEQITQDETYYILDAEPDANVYLGFQENINPDQFQVEFKDSETSGKKATVENYVQIFPSKKHDLYLIPAGTIHCSGKNNMVLEISNTPYIFTFKIYDWQRLDLDGKPRTLNIDRALENLDYDRKGTQIKNKFISKPETIAAGDNWKVLNLPTHDEHLYSVDRLEFKQSIEQETENRFHVLNLVEGDTVFVVNGNQKRKLCYAETIVIPAATGEYTIENCTNKTAKVIKAYMK